MSRRSDGIDFETVLSAVVSHHLKVNDQEFGKRLLPGVDTFNVFTEDADFVKCLRLAEPIVGAPSPDLSAYDRLWSFEHDVDPRKGPSGDLGRSMHNFKRKLRKGSERHRLLVAVKAGLIAADSAGSALIREGHPLEKWINNCFEFDPLTADWVEKKIIRQRISEIERKSDCAFEWHDFQVAAGELGKRALLLSGCGTGKTLAAWNWIKNQLSQRPASRVIFLYPTRSTATKVFVIMSHGLEEKTQRCCMARPRTISQACFKILAILATGVTTCPGTTFRSWLLAETGF